MVRARTASRLKHPTDGQSGQAGANRLGLTPLSSRLQVQNTKDYGWPLRNAMVHSKSACIKCGPRNLRTPTILHHHIPNSKSAPTKGQSGQAGTKRLGLTPLSSRLHVQTTRDYGCPTSQCIVHSTKACIKYGAWNAMKPTI